MLLSAGPMHYVKGHNAESSSGFQGRHEERQLIIVDESSGIPPYIWEGVEAMMVAPNCRLLIQGNPIDASGFYYDIRNDPSYNRIRLSCLDHPNILASLAGFPAPYPSAVSLMWIQDMLAKHAAVTKFPDADSIEFPPGSNVWYVPDDVFRPRVLGLFPKQSSQAIWDEKWLDDARTRKLEWLETDLPELGVDVARFGGDLSVIYSRRGPVFFEPVDFGKQDTMVTTGRTIERVLELEKEHKIPKEQIRIKVDVTGIGSGVVDRLRELGYKAIPIAAGESAMRPDLYYNCRSELWFISAEFAKKKRLDLTRLSNRAYQKLVADLVAPHYKYQSDRTLRVESKDDMKKRIGRSPDHGDGFNLCFYPGREFKLSFA